jgi:DNA-binding winged helix-turn-helix (wHTH) protein
MSVLVCLAAHAPEPVPKEKLLQEVWPDTFVGEGVLTRSIFELRRVFEDEAKEPRVIQTIAKGGYRLLAPVVPVNGASGRRGQNDSVAVFPLANAAANPDAEYLVSGIPGSMGASGLGEWADRPIHCSCIHAP